MAAQLTRRRAQTRQRLLDAAFGVFAERGFGHATVDHVCAAAGFTRGAFYSNFSTLDELFLTLYQQRAGELVQRVTAALAASPAPGAGIAADLPTLIDRVLQALPPDPRWQAVAAEFFAHALRHPPVARALARQRRALRQALAPALTAASAGMDLPAAIRDPDVLARTVVAVHDGTTQHLLLEPGESALAAWQRDVLLLAMGAGVPAPPGGHA